MIIKETSKYSLYKGTLQAEGLFNLTEKSTNKITYWFNDAKELIESSDERFDELASLFNFYD